MSEQALTVVVFYILMAAFIIGAYLVVNKGPAVKATIKKLLGRRTK